ncbi:MAG: DUF934 domain-containing protein [Rhodospirillaceae bacterium]
MAVLLKNGQPIPDSWIALDDTEAAVPDGPVIISLERWTRDRAALAGRNAPLGIRLKSHQLAPAIAADLGRFELVMLEFPKFRDGRHFSTARELRERYRYTGEIRATGHVIPDQYLFMTRVGFSSVEVPDGANLESWRLALNEVSVAYQAGVLDDSPLAGLRRKVAL